MTTNNNNLKTTNNNFKAANNNFKKLVAEYKSEVSQRIHKYDALKDLDLFILDNSIRESTVGKKCLRLLKIVLQIYIAF